MYLVVGFANKALHNRQIKVLGLSEQKLVVDYNSWNQNKAMIN